MTIILVSLGGFLGSILRFYISIKFNKNLIGTWIANITGSIFLAVLFRLHLTNILADWTWIFLGVGFSGAFTTFSTFGNETLQLVLDKKYLKAITYVLCSLSVSFLFVYFILYEI
ncbi:FluC/FEX family fluoride channel [Virgibacillus sp. DJP39]|uniref:FluC/FEX family fluoride channel n=1 Tax=Virgibacillus sp. DJP39 TaxID=3409790 RepID=UPI003BB67C2F